MSSSRLFLRFAATVAALFVALPVLGRAAPVASTLVYFQDAAGQGGPRGLYNFDTDTGVSTFRAPVGGTERFFGMDVRPSDDTVFAVTLLGGLWTIDIDTGATTIIGPTAVAQPVGLAFDPFTGDLFGLVNAGGLYSVDQTTGLFTPIGSAFPVVRGISFSPSGQLFGFDYNGFLFSIDPLTGSSIAVGGSGNSPILCPEGSTFTVSGDLFSCDFTGRIFQTDPVTGDGILIGDSGLGDGLLGMIALTPGAVVSLDIKPGSCPNSFNRNSHGVLPTALVGSGTFDVTQVDLESVLLSRADGVGGAVAPNEGPPGPHSTFEDVATPFGGELCDCHEQDGDGITDLAMKFKSQDVVSELQLNGLPPGDLVELCLSGMTLDKSEFEVCDCIRLVPTGDMDGDGAVGAADFLFLLAEWGPCPPAGECLADLDADGNVDLTDFLLLLGNWG